MSERDELLDRVQRGRFLIDGAWIEPGARRRFEIVTPSDESVFASVPLGSRIAGCPACGSSR